jgi:MarR family transcriptional regulator, organic hydroperoxide resistance regulator
MENDTPSAKRPELADFMCFAVYSANLAYTKVYKPVLEALGLTYTQYLAIIALWEQDNQTVKQLSDRLFLEPSTMTPVLKRLEAMGYVQRSRDPKDERNVRVALTEAGTALRVKGLGLRQAVVDASGLAPEEFASLQKAVARLRDNLLKSSGGE